MDEPIVIPFWLARAPICVEAKYVYAAVSQEQFTQPRDRVIVFCFDGPDWNELKGLTGLKGDQITAALDVLKRSALIALRVNKRAVEISFTLHPWMPSASRFGAAPSDSAWNEMRTGLLNEPTDDLANIPEPL